MSFSTLKQHFTMLFVGYSHHIRCHTITNCGYELKWCHTFYRFIKWENVSTFIIQISTKKVQITYIDHQMGIWIKGAHNFRRYQILYKLLFSRGFYFSRISRARPSQKFPLQFMSIYSNDNIRKIAKLTTRELPHLVQKRENNCTRK